MAGSSASHHRQHYHRPFVLAYVYHLEGGIPYFMLTVGIGEIISCGVLGMLLRTVLQKYRKYIFDVQK